MDVLPQPSDKPEIVGFAEDFLLLGRVRHLDVLQLLAQPLLLVQFRVQAAALHQLMMVAALDDSSLLKNQDFVGVFDR
jgi:hypothetical protein